MGSSGKEICTRLCFKNILRSNETKCSKCKKYLSVSPVHRLNIDEYICGRCKIDNENTDNPLHRQDLFEKIAFFIDFPCSNDEFGCQVQLKFDEVVIHEKNCPYQPINCPLYYNDIFTAHPRCKWKGLVKQLSSHIEQDHKNLIIKPFEVNFEEITKNSIFFAKVNYNFHWIVIKLIEKNKFKYVVMSNEVISSAYEIVFRNKQNDNRFIMKHYIKSITDLDKTEEMEEIDLDSLKIVLKTNTDIFGLFEFTNLNKKEAKDTLLLQELNCPICKQFMESPIYVCGTGHSLCGNCKLKVTKCPTCTASFSNTRNYSLEALTNIFRNGPRNAEEKKFSFGPTNNLFNLKMRVSEINKNITVISN